MASIAPPPSSLAVPVANGAADGAPRSSHAVPVFTGSLEVFCLPDLLEFLRAGRRTGTLVCSSVRGIGAVHLSDGKLSGAAAPNTPRLSELLLAKGKVTAADLKQAAATQEASKSPMPIGTILVKEGKLKTEDLQAALKAQVEGAIAELLAWGEGQFAFDAESRGPAASEGVEIALDPQSVLLEIYRAMDEQGTLV
jgi:hypothetical protein